MYWDSDMHDSMAMRMTRLGQPCRYDGEFMRGGPSDTTGLSIPLPSALDSRGSAKPSYDKSHNASYAQGA